MSVCETISILALEIEGQLDEISESHSRMISVMKDMPKYLAKGDLSKWEEDYRASIFVDEDEQSDNYKAIDLIYEIAALNLYGEFHKNKTKQIYEYVIRELFGLKLIVSKDLNVEEW